jgi:hypothetical protein
MSRTEENIKYIKTLIATFIGAFVILMFLNEVVYPLITDSNVPFINIVIAGIVIGAGYLFFLVDLFFFM